ncbi:MAG: ABC transporter substrate-binding protein [Flavobacteriales bacterium]|nr:ABC transporter substrate-binding protein [Flavobacteriales bacterium]
MRIIKNLALLFLVFASLSCATEEQGKAEVRSDEVEILFKYANHLRVFKNGENYRVEIYGKDKIIQEFMLSRDSSENNMLHIPFKRVVATSTTHLGYIELLDLRKTIVAFPNTRYISDEELYNRSLSGDIAELGIAESMNLEKLFELKPDVIFNFPNQRSNGQSASFTKLGLKTIIVTEFYEESALGKVEWIKFFGILFDKEEYAQKTFEKIENNYLDLISSLSIKNDIPTVFSGIMFGDTWYAPGGNSFTSKFYKLAGAKYVWDYDTSSGSNSFSFEKVFKDAVEADYWIGVGGKKSMDDLLESNSKYNLFKAFKEGNVYSVYGGVTAWGANSYFEKGVLQPDVMLRDLLIIFDKNADKSELVYHKKLN